MSERDHVHVLCLCEFWGGVFDILTHPYCREEGKCLSAQLFPRPLGMRASRSRSMAIWGWHRLAVSGDNRWRRSRWKTEGIANQKRARGRGRVCFIGKEASPLFSRELLIASFFNYKIECYVWCDSYFSLN